MLNSEAMVVHFPAAPMAQEHAALDTATCRAVRSDGSCCCCLWLQGFLHPIQGGGNRNALVITNGQAARGDERPFAPKANS